MPHVDDGSLVTNSDAAMWRQDHASAIRYIEALLAENARLRPLAEVVEKLSAADWEYVADLLRAEGFASYERAVKVCRAIAAALRAAKGEGDE